jgi:hypothetical protein
VGGLREIAAPFVVGAPAGARVRTRLRVSPQDAAVLRAAGSHLGSLAGRDLAARCAEGRLDAAGRAVSRRERKRALTAGSSSRWAGAITRTSENQWRLADLNLHAERASLRARVRRIEARAAAPAGGTAGRARGYASPAERHAKAIRLQVLKGRLARTERRLASGRVAVTRGGRDLLRKRLNLAAAGLTEDQWRRQWEAARLFLTADGEAGKAWGNETIRFNPDEGWLEIKLPAPLASLANRLHGRYRLSCPVAFSYRGDEVAAQAASGAVRYDITFNPASGRWYLDGSWKTADPGPAPAPGELRRHPVVAVDVNAGHLAVAVVAADGNVAGTPFTVPLDLAGLPATTRDGRLRNAISTIIATAREQGARAVVIEDLDFAEARVEGRERTGSRPSRGRRGRGFRRAVSGIPTARFRDRLVQMSANAGLHVIVADPAYTSRWGRSTGSPRCAGTTPRRPDITRLRWCSGDAGSATGPGATRTGTAPPRRTRRGQPRRGPGKTQRQDPPPGNPPPHEAPGSHRALRPADLTGLWQATRQPRTVRGRRIPRTISCYLD